MTRSPKVSSIIHTSPPCYGIPRKPQDASRRFHIHGRVLPMHEPGFFARLLGRR